MISHYEQICACLGAGVRTACVDRSLLCEEKVRTIERQIAVNLVRRYLMITLDSVLAASIHEHLRTEDISLEEDSGFSIERST